MLKKLFAAAGAAALIGGAGMLATASSATAATGTIGVIVANGTSTAVLNSDGSVTLTAGSASGDSAQIDVVSPPAAAPTTAPSFTTSPASEGGDPRWVIEFHNGDILNGLGDPSGNWYCGSVTGSYATALAACEAGGTDDQVTAAFIVADAGEAGVAFTLTDITYDGAVTVIAPVVLGAEGTNGALFTQNGYGTQWQSLGGVISGAPAVVATSGSGLSDSTLFFATAPNHQLWMRSLTDGWQEVSPPALCLGSPAAYYDGTTVTVACEGTNKSLWADSAAWTGTGLPVFTAGWSNLGGVLSAGPAIAPVDGVLTYFALGSNGQVFTSTGNGFTGTSWDCIGTLAAAASDGTATFACQGGDHALWTASDSGSGWSAATSLGGQLTGGPGIAGPAFFAEGTDGAVWENVAGSWSSLGGDVIGGVGAAPLN